MAYNISDFNQKDFSIRELGKFIKEIIKQRDAGKIDAFCTLYDLDIKEVTELLRLAEKFGNNKLIKKVNDDISFAKKIQLWLTNNDVNESYYF